MSSASALSRVPAVHRQIAVHLLCFNVSRAFKRAAAYINALIQQMLVNELKTKKKLDYFTRYDIIVQV